MNTVKYVTVEIDWLEITWTTEKWQVPSNWWFFADRQWMRSTLIVSRISKHNCTEVKLSDCCVQSINPLKFKSISRLSLCFLLCLQFLRYIPMSLLNLNSCGSNFRRQIVFLNHFNGWNLSVLDGSVWVFCTCCNFFEKFLGIRRVFAGQASGNVKSDQTLNKPINPI